MGEVRGTIFARPNGTYTVLAEPTWDTKQNRFRRPSLGTFKTEQEAQAARLRYCVAQSDGVFSMSEVEFRRVRLSEYLDEWIELLDQERLADEITVATQRDYEAIVRWHIVPYLGRKAISQLTVPILHRWLLDIKATGVGDRTVQKAYRTLHRALADSVLKENPTKLPKRWRPKVRDQKPGMYPTVEQVNAFVAHVSDCYEPYGNRYSVLWRIAATCGLRRAELVGLAWPDIDFDACTITVAQTIQVDKGSLYVKGPKSERGYRTIGIDTTMAHKLRRHRTRMLEERTAAGAAYEVQPLGHDFVFRGDRHGSPVNPDRITQAFKREWAHADIAIGPTLHGLRHTNGSLLLVNGMAPIHVATHLGHDLQTLNNVYAHELDPSDRRDAIAGAITAIYG
jgi:integrase